MAARPAWVRFTAPFDWTPPERRSVTIAFPAGHQDCVPRACARTAVEAGKAVRVKAPANKVEAEAARAGALDLELL